MKTVSSSFCSLAACLCVALLATPVAAHHSANNVTSGKPISWQGTVTAVSWDGAHVMYRVEVKDATRAVATWQVLGGSPKRLASRGIFQRTVKAGDAVTVAGYLNPHNQIITPVYLALSDGAKLFVGYVDNDESFSLPGSN